MSTLNIRLPEDLEKQLAREAGLAHKARSELVREALRAHLDKLEHERYLAQFLEEASEVYSNKKQRTEELRITEELRAVEAKPPAEPKGRNTERSKSGWWR